jgi:hypothetical protein
VDSVNATLWNDFLWGWLNGLSTFCHRMLARASHNLILAANTRCIYYQLNASRSDPDNLTMCPILDFANHTSTSKHMSPVPPGSRTWATPSGKTQGDLAFLSPRDILQQCEEIYLCYGAHANRTLFVEYGFTNELPELAAISDEFYGEVDIQEVVEWLFENKGALGTWMKSILEDNGYWG